MAAFTGQLLVSSYQTSGSQDGYGIHKLTALPGSSYHPVPYYLLACLDTLGNRHYWVDTSISLTFAPAGFTYDASTLSIEARF